jgi:hypothetical protein
MVNTLQLLAEVSPETGRTGPPTEDVRVTVVKGVVAIAADHVEEDTEVSLAVVYPSVSLVLPTRLKLKPPNPRHRQSVRLIDRNSPEHWFRPTSSSSRHR